jgi:hypothetical protein
MGATLPWRERARALGSQATAAFPLRDGGGVVGALSLHADRQGYFDASVVDAIEGMADDLSFALHNIDREAARADAMRDAQAGYERFQKIFRALADRDGHLDARRGRLLASNDAFCAFIGHPARAAARALVRELEPGRAARTAMTFVAALTARRASAQPAGGMRVASGELRDVETSAELLDFAGERCMLAILNDVTERRALRVAHRVPRDRTTRLDGAAQPERS